jgi:predicted peroxiredoxin
MPKNRTGFMLASPPDHPNLTTVDKLTEAALQEGHEVYLYLIDQGTQCLNTDAVGRLSKNGVKLFVCAYGAQKWNVPITDQATFCGLVVLSDLMKGCNRFLSFT